MFSFEKNKDPKAGIDGVPEFTIMMIQVRLTEEEIDALRGEDA